MDKIKIIECPRDAMQGMEQWIPTETKLNYLKQLLRVGFDTIDFGSFVSPKAIPQLKDTGEIIERIGPEVKGKNQLLAIIANLRGAEDAKRFEQIDFLGFPLSLSETFQQRNTNKSVTEAFEVVKSVQDLIKVQEVQQVVYLSMGFGNPYGDPWDEEYIFDFVDQLKGMGVRIISLADTIGVSDPERINFIFSKVIPEYPEIEFGAHLHSRPESAFEKLEAAWEAGCRRFDGAIRGFGGCPMAEDDLVGNIDSSQIIRLGKEKNALPSGFDHAEFERSVIMSAEVFPK